MKIMPIINNSQRQQAFQAIWSEKSEDLFMAADLSTDIVEQSNIELPDNQKYTEEDFWKAMKQDDRIPKMKVIIGDGTMEVEPTLRVLKRDGKYYLNAEYMGIGSDSILEEISLPTQKTLQMVVSKIIDSCELVVKSLNSITQSSNHRMKALAATIDGMLSMNARRLF